MKRFSCSVLHDYGKIYVILHSWTSWQTVPVNNHFLFCMIMGKNYVILHAWTLSIFSESLQDNERYFVLNLKITETFLHLFPWIDDSSFPVEKFLGFIESSLLGEVDIHTFFSLKLSFEAYLIYLKESMFVYSCCLCLLSIVFY